MFIAAALAACGRSDEKAAPKTPDVKPPVAAVAPKPEPKAPPVVAVAPKPEPKPVAPPPAPAKQAAIPEKSGWQLLGQQRAGMKLERDRMIVGKEKGTFREIQIKVMDARLELDSIVVTFGNGQQFKPAIKHQFNEKSSSRAIDLPGGSARQIQYVDFIYRSADRRESAATVQLYGR